MDEPPRPVWLAAEHERTAGRRLVAEEKADHRRLAGELHAQIAHAPPDVEVGGRRLPPTGAIRPHRPEELLEVCCRLGTLTTSRAIALRAEGGDIRREIGAKWLPLERVEDG